VGHTAEATFRLPGRPLFGRRLFVIKKVPDRSPWLAVKQGMKTMFDAGLKLVMEGTTTMEELRRVVTEH
jgi:type II secretory ATPase GspE/PulE/Tfp pilus assembly ATPase PilB-like protein